MGFSYGTLTAGSGDVYTQLMAAIKTFAESAGWTTDLYTDDDSYYANTTYHSSGGYAGKRLHMHKSINGTDRYINIKSYKFSVADGLPFAYYTDNYWDGDGLAINGSTGYNVANRWDQQPGYESGTYGAVGGTLRDLPTDSLNYYLVSADSGNNIYLQVATAKGYVGFVFGVTSLDIFVVGASASGYSGNLNTSEKWNFLLFLDNQVYEYTFAAYISGAWVYGVPSTSSGVKLPDHALSYLDTDQMCSHLIYSSPDTFKGNAPLIPVGIELIASSVRYFLGYLPGVKYVNMKNLASLREETYDSDTYKFFRQYAEDNSDAKFGGLAFVIS